MEQVDLKSPGWHVRQGQALWKPDAKKPEIVGDFLLATNPDGNSFVQFSKTFPIVTAQTNPRGWSAEFPPENKHYAGRGMGPKRIVWLQLLRALEGSAPTGYWRVAHPSKEFIVLENEERGERLEVHFQP